jgi:hypothetical protein
MPEVPEVPEVPEAVARAPSRRTALTGRRSAPMRSPRPRTPPEPPAEASAHALTKLRPFLSVVAIGLLGAHLALAREAFTMPIRLLFALPGLFVLAELDRYLATARRSELPFNVVGLIYFYIPFSFPVFFDIKFFDISGPVSFTEHARSSAAIAVALGVLCLYAGMRAGEVCAPQVRPLMLGLLPSPRMPSGFPHAVLACGALVIAFEGVRTTSPGSIPPTLHLFLFSTLSVELAMGLPIVSSELFRGRWDRFTAPALMLIGWSFGLIRGNLEPVFRLGMPFVGARWAYARKFSISLLAAGAMIYVVFQPIKQDFRSQVWGREEAATYSDRLDAWSKAFDNFFSRDSNQDKVEESTIGRIAELDAVMHAFDMVPGQVQFIDGAGWVSILTGPIPRFIWRDKPVTQDSFEQQYARIFHRQTEEGARSTAILLPLLVDGYWNFGWPGVMFVCSAIGLWVGICQKLWSGDHWALNAAGVAVLSRLNIQGHLGGVYNGLFQSIVGIVIACWSVYAVAALISPKFDGAPSGPPVPQRGGAPRAAGRRLVR